MRKSFYIDTEPAFGNLISRACADGLALSLRFSDGDILHCKKGGKSYIEQGFKGRLGYLQHYDIILDEGVTLPVIITRPDLYVAYLMHANKNIQLWDAENDCVATLRERRGRYIYLPAGRYSLRLSAGRYQLFGFYFDVGIFDSGADRTFSFLQPLLEAHRQQASTPLLSPDFSVGRMTESYIQSLCKNLKKHDLDSQVYIISQLKELIKLSKRKIHSELGVSEPHHAILQNAKDLIEQGVDTQGMDYGVSALEKILPIGKANLQLLFKKHFGITPNNYKKKYIIEKSKDMLSAGYPVISIVDALGFMHERSFYRLFKKLTGYSPKTYLNLSKRNDHIK